jgi:signal peptidase I
VKLAPKARWILAVSTVLAALGWTPRASAAGWRSAGETWDAVLSDARAVAAQRPGLSVVRVSGESMLPYFGEDAVLVIKKIDAARLRVGMIAVYVNRFGEKVAHRVIAKVGSGWEVKGYNNDRADSTVVNASNLLGIVYATFAPVGRPTVELAGLERSAVETVYAAPAK